MSETNREIAERGAAALAGVLASMLVFGGMCIAGIALHQRDLQHIAAMERQHQAALAEKQRELQGLASQVVAERTEIKELSSRSSGIQSAEAGPWLPFVATWYDGSGDALNGGQVTASGTHVRGRWTVAVDPRVIPLGSLVEIRFADGTDRLYKAIDTGGAIKGNRIDIYQPDVSACLVNGRQNVMVRVLVRGG